MRRSSWGSAVVAGLLGIGLPVGCAEPAPPDREAAAPARAAATDPALCAEHAVLETVCPKCNPRLAAVFQAKGDWCVEHGFPESFCPICRPEAAGRPPGAPTGQEGAPADGAPADGTLVRFRTRVAAEQAGLETVPAEESAWVDGTRVVARITWDATRVAAVSARGTGVVTAVHAEVGDPVQAGQALAEVQSAQVAADRSRRVAAERARDLAALELARKHELVAGGVSSTRELQEAEQALAAAEAELVAVQAEVDLAGGGQGDRSQLVAPITGVVTARHVHVGQGVSPEQPLFELVDPRRMWAELDVPERELGQVAVGDEVELQLDAQPDARFSGAITTLSPMVDPATRTARARIELDNPDGRLRANQYGTATIRGEAAQAAVVVPDAAVQRAGDAWLVFVRQQVDTYVARRVQVLSRQGGRVRIAGGVAPGDPVVTTGSFLLKTETLKDSIGAGCCDVQ